MKKNKYKLIGTALVILFLFAAYFSFKKSSNENVNNSENINNKSDRPEFINAIRKCSQSKIIGEWFSVEDDKRLKLKNDCSFESEKCKSFGKFTDFFLMNKSDKILFQTTESQNLLNCPIVGDQECIYQLNKENEESVLIINCNENSYKFLNHHVNQASIDKKIVIENVSGDKNKNITDELEKKNGSEEDSADDLLLGGSNQSSTMLNGVACDGIPKEGIKKCYYTNLPLVTASYGTYGKKYWSSNSLDKKIKDQFKSDSIFNLRIVSRKNGNEFSTFNKKCNDKSFIATKLKIKLRLKTLENPNGEIATLISRIDRPSSVWNFNVSSNDNQPFQLEVIDVKSNSRCVKCKKSKYLDLQVGDQKGFAKECAAFDIQFATDATYDLPGKRVNKLLY